MNRFDCPPAKSPLVKPLDLENDFGAIVLKARTEGNAPAFSLKGVARLAAQATVGEAQADHSGIRVEVRLEENEAPTGFSTTTDKDGAFGFAINPGRYKLFLSARDHKPTSTDAITVTGEGVKALDAPIVLEINPGGISGLVRLEDAVEGGNGDITVSLVGTEKAPVTGDDGTFSMGGVGAGIHRLRVSKMGYDTREIAGIVVSAGVVTELPDAIALQSHVAPSKVRSPWQALRHRRCCRSAEQCRQQQQFHDAHQLRWRIPIRTNSRRYIYGPNVQTGLFTSRCSPRPRVAGR